MVNYLRLFSVFINLLAPVFPYSRRRRLRRKTLGRKGFNLDCFSPKTFVDTCQEQLLSDPDSDGIVSQDEYASFLCAESCSFYSLPLFHQLKFVRFVCDHVDDNDGDETDCMMNMVRLNMDGNKFGFILNGSRRKAKNEIRQACEEIYPQSIKSGFVIECDSSEPNLTIAHDEIQQRGSDTPSPSASPTMLPMIFSKDITPTPSGTLSPSEIVITRFSTSSSQVPTTHLEILKVRFSYGIRTDGIDAAALISGRNPENTLKEDLISAMDRSIVEALEEAGATYDSEIPVDIEAALDDTCRSPPPETSATRCIYVKSVVNVVVARSELKEKIRFLVIDGLRRKGIPIAN